MKCMLVLIFGLSLSAVAEEPKRSGHATAQWLAPSASVKAGESFKTVIRLVVDEPWHVYWYNPGEAGMETSIELKLPHGWTSSGLLHPIPKKFKTGGLHGYGHGGTVDYALTLNAPENFKGSADILGNVVWLSCNDDACIPGEMLLKLKLMNGKAIDAAVDDGVIGRVYDALPLRNPMGLGFKFTGSETQWNLCLSGDLDLDPAKASVFIASPELVPASAEVVFKKIEDEWLARVPKGEFAPQKPDHFNILLVEKGRRAIRVEWQRP